MGILPHLASVAVVVLLYAPFSAARLGLFGEQDELAYSSRWLLRSKRDPELLAVAKIFSGRTVVPKRFECMVSLRKPLSNVHYCGGVLIAPDLILTAAHCMDSGFSESSKSSGGEERSGFSQPNPVAYIGGSRVDISDPDAEVIPSCTTIVHDGWNGKLLDGFDIALIKLQFPSQKSPCEIYDGQLSSGQVLTALGWGASETKSYLPSLQKVDTLEYETLDECNVDEKWLGHLKPGMICADGPNGEDTCGGDSGGPLLLEGSDNGEDQVVGITSFGHVEGCGRPGLPGVYTNVSHFLGWIFNEGQDESRIFEVPFCGNPNPDTGNLSDDIAAKIVNGESTEAVEAIARSAEAEDINSIEEAATVVSEAGQGEKVVNALVEAVDEAAINSSLGVHLIAMVSKKLPGADSVILSGGGLETDIAAIILMELKNGNIEAAAKKINEAVQTGRSQDVLIAISGASKEGLDEETDLALALAIDLGSSHSELATILAPWCGDDSSCWSRLAGVDSLEYEDSKALPPDAEILSELDKSEQP